MNVTKTQRRKARTATLSTAWIQNPFAEAVLMQFLLPRKEKSLQDLKGKISFSDDYNYKDMRK